MFHQLCCGAACHPAPRICSVPGHGPLPHSAPEELAAGDTDGRCRALEAGPSPAMRAVAAWEPAKLAMGRCGARDVVCRDMLESSHDPLPRGSGRRQPLQSPRCRPPVAAAELFPPACVTCPISFSIGPTTIGMSLNIEGGRCDIRSHLFHQFHGLLATLISRASPWL